MADNSSIELTTSLENLKGFLDKIPNRERRRRVSDLMLDRISVKYLGEILRRIPKATGMTAAGFTRDVNSEAETISIKSNGPVGRWIQYGTGIYTTEPGKTPGLIFPVHAKAMRWPTSRGGHKDLALSGRHKAGVGSKGQMAFARSIRGMRPRPFFEEAMVATTPYIEQIIADAETHFFGDH